MNVKKYSTTRILKIILQIEFKKLFYTFSLRTLFNNLNVEKLFYTLNLKNYSTV